MGSTGLQQLWTEKYGDCWYPTKSVKALKTNLVSNNINKIHSMQNIQQHADYRTVH